MGQRKRFVNHGFWVKTWLVVFSSCFDRENGNFKSVEPMKTVPVLNRAPTISHFGSVYLDPGGPIWENEGPHGEMKSGTAEKTHPWK